MGVVAKQVYCTFPKDRIREPILYNLGQNFQVIPNIRGASIDDDIGLHKVGNATRERAMSLHIYAPGWETVQLYDETMPPEVTDAGGAAIDVDAWGD